MSDFDFWRRLLSLITSDPDIMLGGGGSLIAAAVALTRFLKDAVDKGEIKQLKATVEHVQTH